MYFQKGLPHMEKQKEKKQGHKVKGQKYKSLLAQGKTYRQITIMTGISKSTLIRAKNQGA
jgi:DNA invertase Pin-like site-specific DNA recombinase